MRNEEYIRCVHDTNNLSFLPAVTSQSQCQHEMMLASKRYKSTPGNHPKLKSLVVVHITISARNARLITVTEFIGSTATHKSCTWGIYAVVKLLYMRLAEH